MRVIAGPEKKTRVMSREGAPDHRLPRDGPRDRRPPAAEHRPGPQDLDHQPRPGARLHDQPADRGQVPHHPRRADRHDGDDPGRPRRRGDRLRRDHHRRLQRPREGDRDGEADGDALRHVRAPRPARLRPRSRPALPRPRVLLRARLLGRDRPRDRRRDPPHRRGRPPDRQGPARPRSATSSTGSRRSCSSARRSTPSSSSPCSTASPRTRSSPTRRSRRAGRAGAGAGTAAARGRAAESAAAARVRRRRRRAEGVGRPRARQSPGSQLGAEYPPVRSHRATRGELGARYFAHERPKSDGRRQRDARLVLGRGALPRPGGGDRAWARSWRETGRTSSTSAASRRGRGPRRSAPRRSCARVEPVVAGARRRSGTTVSIDTSKAAVAEAALDAGATIVNDVTALRGDPEMAALCAERGADRRPDAHAGRPADDAGRTRPTRTSSTRSRRSSPSGSRPRSPPGSPRSGSGSTPGSASARPLEHNLELLRRLGELRELGRPLVVGTSRKSFIGKIDGSDGRRAARRHDRLLGPRRRRGRRRPARPRRRRGRARRLAVAAAILG